MTIFSLQFLRAWLADPMRMGAIAPSSDALASAITAKITPDSAPVIELGSGTGALTRSIIARGIPEERLVLVEQHHDFARNLMRVFPKARVIAKDASQLQRGEVLDGVRAGAVVSGVPLLLLPPSEVIAILRASFRCLRLDGAFYQFTYGLRAPVSDSILGQLDLQTSRIGGTFANLPPAVIYEFKRRDSPSRAVRRGAKMAHRVAIAASPLT
jgi:phospholipid N-methyltransferase